MRIIDNDKCTMEIEPMLLEEVEDMSLLDNPNKIFQEKHNGTRAIIHIKGGKIVGIRGRSNNPLLFCYPELKEVQFSFDTAILDGEVCVFKEGKSVFYGGIDQRRSSPTAAKLRDYPVTLIVFDAIQFEDQVLVYKPYSERLNILELNIGLTYSNRCRVVESTQDGRTLWNKMVTDNREGVVVKEPKGIYELGKRSKQFLKLKNYKLVDVVVENTEVNEKGTKIFATTDIGGKAIKVEAQQAGMFNIHVGDTIRVKYLDVVGERLIQPTRC